MGSGDQGGRRTVDDIQEATSEPILGEGMFEARLLPETLEVTDPPARTQRCRWRRAYCTRTAQRLTEDRKIQNLTFPFQRQALPAWRYLHPKHILDDFRGRSFESVIVYGERYKVIEEGEQRIIISSTDDQRFSTKYIGQP